ncbi:MAG: S1 RNA-binding domain-containing protein [Patescibacteria group bacterium]|jgi:small subunit ribosomal protein S1|nr:S1 RNA-binding domain-containing protein [Patescibacteria group bacterium]
MIEEKKVTDVDTQDGEDVTKSKMEELLKDFPVQSLQEGKKIKGVVIEIDKHALFVDLGEYGTGIVYGKEIKDGIGDNRKKLKKGSEIVATIVDQENEEGYVELSVKEAMMEEAWNDLRDKMSTRDVLSAKILDANKGGLMVEINGIVGFMPVSQLSAEHYPRVDDGDKNKIFEILKSYVATDMRIVVLDAIEDEEKLIVSEKEAYNDEEKEAISEFKMGDIVEGEISGVVDFGAFVKFFPPSKKEDGDEKDKLEGLVHISQLDWKLISNPRDVVKVGDKIKAKIIDIDETRISLSIRELKNDPWANVGEDYKVGDIVDGTVNKINHFGAFVYLDKDIHGLAHVSEFISKYPNKNIDEVIVAGEVYKWQIMSMDPNEHRMGLKFIGKGEKAVKDVAKKEDKKEDEKEDEKPASAKATAGKEEKKSDKKKADKKADVKKEEDIEKESKDKKKKDEKKESKADKKTASASSSAKATADKKDIESDKKEDKKKKTASTKTSKSEEDKK